jgi:pyridoxine/pyridoxamine 5'-phosphate oxidase
MKIDLARSEYERGALSRSNLKPDPFDQFAVWFGEAWQSAWSSRIRT